MGIIESRTGKVVKENKKSQTHGYVKDIVIKENEAGEKSVHVNIEMNDL